ncbi:MAG: hypothetical protein H7210_10620 [Pyrinomonadaceae bacterium]|nr:hypothetical protein [Phycisphaerales bacterium]
MPVFRTGVRVSPVVAKNLAETRRAVQRLEAFAAKFGAKLKELEAQDKLGNFEIQDLMSDYNQTETLASSVLKKRDDTANAIIQKI